jgi:beta-glucuronidase
MNHTGGYLPFKGDVTSLLNYEGDNLLVLALNNTLTPSTIPQGTLTYPTDHSKYVFLSYFYMLLGGDD